MMKGSRGRSKERLALGKSEGGERVPGSCWRLQEVTD